jgi:peptidoglycan/LPS O-acetylase OafA/YrhL
MVFENKSLMKLGKISYGVYVYHWPLLVISKIYLIEQLVNVGLSNHQSYVIISISAGLIAIIVSLLSFNLFEKRILAVRERVILNSFIKRPLSYLKHLSSKRGKLA